MVVRKQTSPRRTPSSKADMQAELAEVRAKLAFLVSLKGADFQALVAGDRHAASGKQAGAEAELARLVERVNKLAASVQRSLTSVDSKAMAAILEHYAGRHPAGPASGGSAPPDLGEWIAGVLVSEDRQTK